jgi:hypothetical protein
VADVPRGGIGFFSLGQLSRFGTLYLHGEQDRIASLGKFPCGLADRVRGIKCVCLTEETVETLYLLASETASSASPAMWCARYRLAARSRE